MSQEISLLILIETKKDLDAHDITPHMIEADNLSPLFRAKPANVIVLSDITT